MNANLRTSLIKLGKSMLIAAGAGAATVFVANYKEIDLGSNTVALQGVISVLIVAFKEYLRSRPRLEEIDTTPDYLEP